MDASKVSDLNRKRKVEYRKVKGRSNHRVSNFLNKSVSNEHVLKHNSSNIQQSQLVSVKNINAFLEKNKDLAKALQDTKLQLNELEKEKFSIQLENGEMRTKLNVATNNILKCECLNGNSNSGTQTLELLDKLRYSLSQSKNLFTEYMDLIAMEKIGEKACDDHTIILNNPPNMCCAVQKEVQTDAILVANVHTQTHCISKQGTKNKKVQVTHSKDSSYQHYCCSEEHDYKSTQTESVHTRSKMVQCSIQVNNFETDVSKSKPTNVSKAAKRMPLQPINPNQLNYSPSKLVTRVHHHSILKSGNRKSPFKVYGNENQKSAICNKEIKRVTIQSPIEVFKYDSEEENKESRKLRSRRNRPIYTELDNNRRLKHGDRGVDTKFYYSPAVKKTKRKKKTVKNKNVIPLEQIISFVQQSLLLSPI